MFEIKYAVKSSPFIIITIKSVYSSNGWFLYFNESVHGKRITRITVVKLIDTNDENVKSAMKNIRNIENPVNQLAFISLKPETIAILVGVIILASIVIFILKKH